MQKPNLHLLTTGLKFGPAPAQPLTIVDYCRSPPGERGSMKPPDSGVKKFLPLHTFLYIFGIP